jgi:hypothetical protein
MKETVLSRRYNRDRAGQISLNQSAENAARLDDAGLWVSVAGRIRQLWRAQRLRAAVKAEAVAELRAGHWQALTGDGAQDEVHPALPLSEH